MSDLRALRDALRAFNDERDWGRFHDPKNLAISLSLEAAEVLEHFQWVRNEESQARASEPERRAAIKDELADVLIYLVLLADRLDVDLVAAGLEKLERNRGRYPADQVRGDARKHDEY